MSLQDYLASSTRRYPDNVAVEDPQSETKIRYSELDSLSNRVRDYLAGIGVRRGDRVGIYLRKSIDTIAAIFGILKIGAAYVPVDPAAPSSRNAFILSDCKVRAIVIESGYVTDLQREFSSIAFTANLLQISTTLCFALDESGSRHPAKPVENRTAQPDDLAYVLYTSGSTGKPKGVMITHQNAESFVDWCCDEFQPESVDRFSSHAPFHFDLAIFDIFVALRAGATIVLVSDEVGKEPASLARLIAHRAITVWYSAPSILSLMAQRGGLNDNDYSHLRLVLFAGEVFPIAHLKSLRRQLPHPRFYNLYGPTETNVCTYFRLPMSDEDSQDRPYPIGRICPHLEAKIIHESGMPVAPGRSGELCIAGPSIMAGYWNLPERTNNAFIRDDSGTLWYRTGDIVEQDSAGNYTYIGRRDRMIKRRGYRVELGEIEACLYQIPEIQEAAVVATSDSNGESIVVAHLVTRTGERMSTIKLKRFCADRVPLYMIPDTFRFCDALPKTSTAKVDYQLLVEASLDGEIR